VHGVDDRTRCTCGRNPCDRVGKHPWPIDGQVAISSDAETLEAWLAATPGANLAIATGRSRVVVVEFDLRILGADVSHDDLTEQYPLLRDAPCVFSGGGSPHYYFAQPPGVAMGFHVARLAHAVDVLGGPALALLPPSRHRSGRGCVWEAGVDVRELELPMLAGGLLAALVALDQARKPAAHGRLQRSRTITSRIACRFSRSGSASRPTAPARFDARLADTPTRVRASPLIRGSTRLRAGFTLAAR